MQDLLSLSYADCHGGHKGALQSRARSVPRKSMKFQFLVLLTASFLALYGSGGLSTTGALAEPPVQPACELDGKKATCTCKQGGSPQKLDVTISEEKNEFQLVCNDGSTCAPLDLKDNMVCPSGTPDVAECKGDHATKCIPVGSLLSGDASNIKWEDLSKINEQCTQKVLTIPKINFPYVDEGFVVGCVASEQSKCTVNVAISARATVTEDRTVKCAYGTGSNAKHHEIRLSPSQNSFTIMCGDKGEVLPTNYSTAFCPILDKNADAKTECSESYTSVLPAYTEGWWKTDSQNSFVLTIPSDKFPENEAKIMVGCQKMDKVAEKKEPTPGPTSSVCSVEVTIEGSGAPSSSATVSPGILAVIVLVAGAANAISSKSYIV